MLAFSACSSAQPREARPTSLRASSLVSVSSMKRLLLSSLLIDHASSGFLIARPPYRMQPTVSPMRRAPSPFYACSAWRPSVTGT